MPVFSRYIGIDYSGAGTAETSLKGIRVYHWTLRTGGDTAPIQALEVLVTRALAGWLLEQLSSGSPAIVGIDHRFSFQ